MGLTISHGAWSGSYHAFHLWRAGLAEAADFPPLIAMKGFWRRSSPEAQMLLRGLHTINADPMIARCLPLDWGPYDADPLTVLLRHDDDRGVLTVAQAKKLVPRLKKLLPKLPPDGAAREKEGRLTDARAATRRFIKALERAIKANERLEFS